MLTTVVLAMSLGLEGQPTNRPSWTSSMKHPHCSKVKWRHWSSKRFLVTQSFLCLLVLHVVVFISCLFVTTYTSFVLNPLENVFQTINYVVLNFLSCFLKWDTLMNKTYNKLYVHYLFNVNTNEKTTTIRRMQKESYKVYSSRRWLTDYQLLFVDLNLLF